MRWERIEPQEPEYGPPRPQFCPDGPGSHLWLFTHDGYDGSSIRTAECPICDHTAQHSSWPSVFLTLHEMPVRLESFTEVYGYETPEYDHYVVMAPDVEALT